LLTSIDVKLLNLSVDKWLYLHDDCI